MAQIRDKLFDWSNQPRQRLQCRLEHIQQKDENLFCLKSGVRICSVCVIVSLLTIMTKTIKTGFDQISLSFLCCSQMNNLNIIYRLLKGKNTQNIFYIQLYKFKCDHETKCPDEQKMKQFLVNQAC